MLELDWGERSTPWRFGGDTLNTAVYLARLGCDTTYVTALGSDAMSAWLAQSWETEGIRCILRRVPGRLPGLYAVHTDADGERHFHYWRSESAARSLLEPDDDDDEFLRNMAQALLDFDWVYVSLISLSVFGPSGSTLLLDMVQQARRHGTKLAFDSNYRAAGWASVSLARDTLCRWLPAVDTYLPSFADECDLFHLSDPNAVHKRLGGLDCPEIVLKDGPRACWVRTQTGQMLEPHAPPRATHPTDTTGAGDAFNAGYLAARGRGDAVPIAVAQGHRVALQVIARRGAIVPRAAWQ